MLKLSEMLSSKVKSAFKAIISPQSQLPFSINRQALLLLWFPFLVILVCSISSLLLVYKISIEQRKVLESSQASIALGDVSAQVSDAVVKTTGYILSPEFSVEFNDSHPFEIDITELNEAQKALRENLSLHPEALLLQRDIEAVIKQDLAFMIAIANSDTETAADLRIARTKVPNLHASFAKLNNLILAKKEKHDDLLKLNQYSFLFVSIAGILGLILSILYGLRLSGNDFSSSFNRLSQDIRRLRRGESLSISNMPPTQMNQVDQQLFKTSQHLQEKNDALAAQKRELELQQTFRKGLSDFISESLQHGLQTNFYHKLLDRAVEVIPNSQAGSLLLLKSDGRYHYEAVVNYQLEAMSVLSFDAEEIALHYSDTEPSRFQDFSINQELNIFDTSESAALLADSAGGRHRSVTDSLAIPVQVEGVTRAYLTLDNFEELDVFGNEAISMAEIFAAQVGTVITRLSLQKKLHLRQEEIQQRNEELARADRLKSEFLANMSHELRTPLTAILGFSELLKEEIFGELNEKQNQYVGDIYKSGDHLLSLINDILDLSKVEAGHMELNRDRHDFAELVDSVIGIMKERARKANVQIETSIPDNLDALFVDGRKVKQILFNLISNAVKFTHEGGRVEINVIPREHKLEVQVQDTGIGISEKNQKKLFQEFSQIDATLTKAHEGTGLGLVLSKRFIELHGGKIWVESAEDIGSSFIFTLPFGTSQVELHKKFADFADTKLRPGIVIFADVTKVHTEVESLKAQDYRVLVTDEATALIEQLSRPKRVDLIIIDEAIHKSTNLVKEVSERLKVNQQHSPIMLIDLDKTTISTNSNEIMIRDGIITLEGSQSTDVLESSQSKDIDISKNSLGHGIDSIIKQPFEQSVFLEKVSTLIYRDIKASQVLLVGTDEISAGEGSTGEVSLGDIDLNTILTRLGHDLTVCADAETALKYLAEKHYDLLLCHFSLPDMSAADLLATLEDMNKPLNDTTVVLLSEGDDLDDLKEFFDDSIFFEDFKSMGNSSAALTSSATLDTSSEVATTGRSDTKKTNGQIFTNDDDNQISERLRRYLWHHTKQTS